MNPTIKGAGGLVLGAFVLACVINTFRPNPLRWSYQQQPVTPAGANSHESEVPGSVELDDLKRAGPGDVLIIDVRPSLFYKRSRIPHAINLAKEYMARDYILAEPVLRNSGARRLVVYCSHESCEDAQTVARELIRLGFHRVAVFKGGWKSWEVAGLPQEKG